MNFLTLLIPPALKVLEHCYPADEVQTALRTSLERLDKYVAGTDASWDDVALSLAEQSAPVVKEVLDDLLDGIEGLSGTGDSAIAYVRQVLDIPDDIGGDLD